MQVDLAEIDEDYRGRMRKEKEEGKKKEKSRQTYLPAGHIISVFPGVGQ